MNTPYDTPREPIDLAEIAIFNAGVMFSRLAYEAAKPASEHEGIDYPARYARSEQARRYYQARKDAS